VGQPSRLPGGRNIGFRICRPPVLMLDAGSAHPPGRDRSRPYTTVCWFSCRGGIYAARPPGTRGRERDLAIHLSAMPHPYD